MELKAGVVGGVLLLAAASSSALTMGRVRGAAIVGQPLNIGIQVQLDGDETAASLCFEADVFHGDTRLDGSRVRITTDLAPQAQTANVFVSSSTVVDEPVVTVYLRAGCSQKITRRYVLLADFPSDNGSAGATTAPLVMVSPGLASAPGVVPSASSAVMAVPAAPTSSNASVAIGPVTQAAPASRIAPSSASVASPLPKVAPPAAPKPKVVPKPAVREVPRPAPTPEVAPAKPASAPAAPPKPAASAMAPVPQASASAAPAQSRLKLDPVELPAEKIASLESAAASAPMDAAARDAQRLQSLEGDLKSLLALAAKNETSLLDLQARLQKAESERYANPLVYGLGALLALCVGGIAYLMGRRRTQPQADADARPDDWWKRAEPSPSGTVPLSESMAAALAQDAAPSRSVPLSAPAVLAPTESASRAQRTLAVTQVVRDDAPLTQVDVSLLEMSESNFDQLMQTGTTHSAVRKVLPSSAVMTPASTLPRNLNSEELFDIRQQAEFFVSLGQTDQAVRVLETRIQDQGESSPLAYLDLLKIFHTAGLKTDFRQFREDFSLLFNVNVPEFTSFAQEGKSLEDYPEVFARISAAWPTSQVLSIIETSVYRDPRNDQGERFDLGAFRELLLLHAVAQSVMSAAVASLKGDRAAAMPLAPVSMSAALAAAPTLVRSGDDVAPLPILDAAPGDIDLDLDLDLTDAPAATASTFDLMLPSAPAVLAGATTSPAAPAAPAAAMDGNLLEFDPSGLGTELKLPRAADKP